ncbi:hypothetical protein OH76DRAFT_617774 [Lentinus brumalis]|uniref:Secreted protein n=1 Tax=Lentinus brumalis TaxID=2498619 RepID=A0A371D8W0_9APHY|nr:hypothetical protein OH76DRAFT_617774 [Polyporus brumalis]
MLPLLGVYLLCISYCFASCSTGMIAARSLYLIVTSCTLADVRVILRTRFSLPRRFLVSSYPWRCFNCTSICHAKAPLGWRFQSSTNLLRHGRRRPARSLGRMANTYGRSTPGDDANNGYSVSLSGRDRPPEGLVSTWMLLQMWLMPCLGR